LEQKKAEVTNLNEQIEKLEKAKSDGVIDYRSLADLKLRRDALRQYVRQLVRTLEIQLSIAPGEPAGTPKKNAKSASPIEGENQRIERLQERLHDLEKLIDRGRIVSPAAGKVTMLSARSGDAVLQGIPFVQIEETASTLLDAYLPEYTTFPTKVGDKVAVLPKRAEAKPTTGTVAFIYPGVYPLPDRMMALNFKIHPWVRKISIKLEPANGLLPGEEVQIKMLTPGKWASWWGRTANASPSNLQTIAVPESLKKLTRFEPSGLLWIEDLRSYLVVSDDTGFKDRDEHAPWLFLMDEKGRMEPQPIVLQGVGALNDLESATMDETGLIYLLSSQNPSKKGKRNLSRQLLLEVRREGRTFTVTRTAPFYSILTASLKTAELEALGLKEFLPNGELTLNVEGLAWRNGSLYFGLKEPAGPEGALIWQLKEPGKFLETQSLAPGQFSLFAQVDLGANKGHRATISDMTVDRQGRLILLSAIAGVPESEQLGGVHVVDQFRKGVLKSRGIASFPGYKPEGVAFARNGVCRIVFDRDDAPSLFTDVKINNDEQ